MKIEKKLKYKNKLLKLKLLQTKIFEKKHHLNNITLEDIEYRIKKALHVIYKYHFNDKKILFVGDGISIYNNIRLLLKNSKHVWIPESVWVNGMLTNPSANFKHVTKNRKTINNDLSKILLKLKKKSDLVVVLNHSTNINVLKESYRTKIPVIFLNNSLNILDSRPSYKIPGTFKFSQKKIRNTFFYSILAATIKKASQIKLNQQNLRPSKTKLVLKKKIRINKNQK